MKKTFRRAFIELTNNCNLSCSFCAPSSRPKRDMPAALFESAAAQAGELAEVISLHVLGEPLSHPEFPDRLALCSRLGLRVNLVTNGLQLPDFPPELFREKCLSQISISLHALACLPKEARAAAIRRMADFARAKPPGLVIGFRLRSEVEDEFFKQAIKALLGAFGRTARPGSDYVELAGGTFLNFGGIFDWPGTAAGKPRHGCLGLRHHFGVLSDGRVVPCCADYDGALALGDLNKTRLASILAAPAAAALRDGISAKTPMPSFCASCGFSPPDA